MVQQSTPAERIHRFLETEAVVWLATVNAAGSPGLVPVWFWWDGEAILVASKPDARKVRNIRANGRVMLALGDADADFDVGLIEARAELVDIPTRSLLTAGLWSKYADRMAEVGLTATEFEATYRQVIRLTPSRPLPWRGRSRPPGKTAVPRSETPAVRRLFGLLGHGARLIGRGASA